MFNLPPVNVWGQFILKSQESPWKMVQSVVQSPCRIKALYVTNKFLSWLVVFLSYNLSQSHHLNNNGFLLTLGCVGIVLTEFKASYYSTVRWNTPPCVKLRPVAWCCTFTVSIATVLLSNGPVWWHTWGHSTSASLLYFQTVKGYGYLPPAGQHVTSNFQLTGPSQPLQVICLLFCKRQTRSQTRFRAGGQVPCPEGRHWTEAPGTTCFPSSFICLSLGPKPQIMRWICNENMNRWCWTLCECLSWTTSVDKLSYFH